MDQRREKKLKLILYFTKLDWSSSKISNYLNKKNIKTFSGLKWTPKLVWVNRDKYLKRLKRYDQTEVTYVKEKLFVVKDTNIFEDLNG